MKQNRIPGHSLLVILLFFSSALSAQSGTYTITLDKAPLESVITQLENKYQLLFSYKYEDIQSVVLTVSVQDTDLGRFLKKVFQNTGLGCELVDTKFVLLKKINAPAPSPTDTLIDESGALLCGIIVDSLSDEPLAFAGVYILRTREGVSALESGKFRFRSRVESSDTLVITYVGYYTSYIPVREILVSPCPVIRLSYRSTLNQGIMITDYLTDGIELGENGAMTLLRPDRVQTLPGQAEPDVLRTIHFLPGISAPDGEASNVYIRGGTPDQNLILWEHIPIYHAAHYFGMISAFNPYIIDQVKVYRGGFGANYGGRISGVIDMRSDKTTDTGPTFGAGLNALNGYAYGKTSFAQKKAALVYSFRRSFSELWRSPMFEEITQRNQQSVLFGNLPTNAPVASLNITNAFDFLDAHVKASVAISDKDLVSTAWFYGNNHFEDQINETFRNQTQVDELDLSNQGGSLSWTHQWRPGFSSKLVGVSTGYRYDYGYDIQSLMGPLSDKSGIRDNNITERQLHFTHSYLTPRRHQFQLGYQLASYDVTYTITQEFSEAPEIDENIETQSDLHVLHAGFLTAKEQPLGLDVGLRWSYYGITEKQYLEPRLRLWYNPTETLNLNANAGRYHQFLSQLLEFKGDNFGIDMPVWVLAGEPQVPVLTANQYQVGLIYHKKSWVVDVQGYYKQIRGLTSLASGFELDLGPGYHLGTASIRGLDLLLKKRWKHYKTWVSYSLSQVDYHFDTFFDQDFPASYDQRHILHWANLFSFGDFEASIGWRLASGKPFTPRQNFELFMAPMGRVSMRPRIFSYNDANFPLQHQLDASLRYRIRPKNGEKWSGVIGVSFLNLYNQENLFTREYFIDIRPNTRPRIAFLDKSDLGFAPNAVVRFEW